MANGELPIPRGPMFFRDPTQQNALTPAWTEFFRQLAGSTGAVRAGGAAGRALIQEPPIGNRDGSTRVFRLTYRPAICDVTGDPSLILQLNGDQVTQFAYAEQGWVTGGGDYTLEGNVITFTVAPAADDYLLATYFADVPDYAIADKRIVSLTLSVLYDYAQASGGAGIFFYGGIGVGPDPTDMGLVYDGHALKFDTTTGTGLVATVASGSAWISTAPILGILGDRSNWAFTFRQPLNVKSLAGVLISCGIFQSLTGTDSVPASLKIYDVTAAVEYFDGTTATIRPRKAVWAPVVSANDNSTCANPGQAIDGDPTSYALIERSKGGTPNAGTLNLTF